MPSQRPPASRSRKNIFIVKTLHPLPQTSLLTCSHKKGPIPQIQEWAFSFRRENRRAASPSVESLGKERGCGGGSNPSSARVFLPRFSPPAYLLASGLASAFGAALSSAFGAAVMGSSLTGAKVTFQSLSISAITSLVTSDLGSNASRLSAFIMTEASLFLVRKSSRVFCIKPLICCTTFCCSALTICW